MEDKGYMGEMKMIGRAGCEKCNGTGIVKGEFGIEVECSCVADMRAENKNSSAINTGVINNDIISTPVYGVKQATKDKLVKLGIIPEHRIKDEFNSEHSKIVLLQMCQTLKCNVNKEAFDRYIDIIETLLTGLRVGQLPRRSYIIGGCNGLGKTTFVNTAIKIMAERGMKVVPYISLSEIAYKMADDIKKAEACISNLGKNRNNIDNDGEYIGNDIQRNEFTWQDYVNADLVFACLTGPQCMWLEMSTLDRLLQLRSMRGKATIIITDDSLEWYWNDERVGKYIMCDIMEAQMENIKLNRNDYRNLNEDRLDKLTHISVWIKRMSPERGK